MKTIARTVKNALKLDKCYIKAYYRKVVVNYYIGTPDIFKSEDYTSSELADELGYFQQILPEDIPVEVVKEDNTIIINIEKGE